MRVRACSIGNSHKTYVNTPPVADAARPCRVQFNYASRQSYLSETQRRNDWHRGDKSVADASRGEELVEVTHCVSMAWQSLRGSNSRAGADVHRPVYDVFKEIHTHVYAHATNVTSDHRIIMRFIA